MEKQGEDETTVRHARSGGRVLVVPYPSQGHINPMLQLSKRLASKGLKPIFVLTKFISNAFRPSQSVSSIKFDTISDGYDQGGFNQAESIHAYLATLQSVGSQELAVLTRKHQVQCVIYDSFLPWALDVAKQQGVLGASFFTQPCAVNYIYYHAYHGLLTLPDSADSLPVCIPGMPPLHIEDFPSFIYVHGSYPAYFQLVLNQFLNVEKADYTFVNTFYELEAEVVDAMSNISPLMTIGPTIPSSYLDKQFEDDCDYGLHLFDFDSNVCTEWLSNKPKGSVVFVSFGSMANLVSEQMEEIAWALKESGYYYLWVVRASEEAKLPKGFEKASDKGLLVKWSPQLEVLSSEALGCFFSHAGWNSTIEAISLGVPMVVMPQWTDQPTNAKLVQDVWEVGVRVKVDEKGLVGKEEIKSCIGKVLEGESGKEMKRNAMKWKDLAKQAMSKDGSSDKNMDEFVTHLRRLSES